MRFFIDTEFDGLTLISLGAVCENGDTYYAENADVDLDKLNPWLKKHVVPHLFKGGPDVLSPERIGFTFARWVAARSGAGPEFWAWCGAYDWVIICELYGGMMHKPKGWPSYVRDLQQELDRHGLTDDDVAHLRKAVAHHALGDADEVRAIHRFLEGHP